MLSALHREQDIPKLMMMRRLIELERGRQPRALDRALIALILGCAAEAPEPKRRPECKRPQMTRVNAGNAAIRAGL